MARNGRLPPNLLAPIPGGSLSKEAAGAWNAMSAESQRRFGVVLRTNGPDSSYRTFDRQVYWRNWWCAKGKCGNAAVPGTSNHGLGLAVDVPQQVRSIIDRIGEPFGWAKRWSDAPHESWHVKYRSGIFAGAAAASVDPLTKRERRLVDELQKIRRTHGTVWNKAELARAREIKRWIVRQRERIRAEAAKTGWTKANRRARYDLLGRVHGG
jgi:D-alanyl-D-alanine carboxypeptidase